LALLKNKLADSSQPLCWCQFYHNTKTLTLSHNI